jgi:4-hydroxybenzoate polyprenyltransferase
VRQVIVRLITAIQLTRLTIAFGAVSDIWFIILYTKATERYAAVEVYQLPLTVALLVGAVVAVGLFAYGASLNDVLDVRHDTTFSPERPIPAGRIRLGQAIVVTVGALIIAVLGGAAMGTWSVCLILLTAAALLFYNATGKYIPPVGIVVIGLIHAAHMFIPNHELSFILPVWLVMTHSMVIAGAVHVMEDKRPRLTPRSLALTGIGWAFWSAMILSLGVMRAGGIWPDDVPSWRLVFPAIVLAAFVMTARFKTTRVTGRAAAEKLKRYGAMWQSLYGAAWLLAVDLPVQAVWIGLFAVAGFVAMTLIKEVTGLSDKPVDYRA